MASGAQFGRKQHPATASVLTLIRQGMSFKVVSEKTGISGFDAQRNGFTR